MATIVSKTPVTVYLYLLIGAGQGNFDGLFGYRRRTSHQNREPSVDHIQCPEDASKPLIIARSEGTMDISDATQPDEVSRLVEQFIENGWRSLTALLRQHT